MQELRPSATTIAVLVNPGFVQTEMQVTDIQAAAHTIGKEIKIVNARTVREINAAFAELAQMRADALLVATDPLFLYPRHATGGAGRPLCNSHAVLSTRVRRRRWAHELWTESR